MFRNLAGNKGCDAIIADELRRCRIQIVATSLLHLEVPARIAGQLRSFSFERGWRYWMVNGRMPLSVAQLLYEDPVGRTDIRVSGNCTCPAPVQPWTEYYDAYFGGNRLLDRHQEEEYAKARKIQGIASLLEEKLKTIRFVDDPTIEGIGFVTSYHIDSEIGLRVFADTITQQGVR